MERISLFLMEKALEIVLAFDSSGKITYVNNSGRKKLGYEEGGLCGRHISDVFPNTFQDSGGGFATGFVFGDEPQNLIAYRKT